MRWGWPLLVLLAACPRVPAPVERPRVEVAALASGDVPALRLRIDNANDAVMTVRAIDWRLDVDGRPPIRGRARVELAIPAGGEALAEVPLDGAAATPGARYTLRAIVHGFSSAGDAAQVVELDGVAR